MQRRFSSSYSSRVVSLALAVSVALPTSVWPGQVDLAKVPLANSTTTLVLPNLMYVQDNSGSMNWDYGPDTVATTANCKGTGNGTGQWCCRSTGTDHIEASNTDDVCIVNKYNSSLRGMPPFLSSDYNHIYYNPEVTYALPVDSRGDNKTVSYGTNYSAVPLDGYGKQFTATMNLITSFPDVEWCTTDAYTDCLRNDNYLLPGSVGAKSYTVMHIIKADMAVTAKFATGAVGAATTFQRKVGPFYYVIVPGEYCTAPDLKVCQAANAPTSEFSYPAKVRWCKDSALSDCKAVWQKNTYVNARYPTVRNNSGVVTPGSFIRVDINPAQATYGNITSAGGQVIVNRGNRLDCAARPTCTYAEEMANFANWFAWYRTRLQMMKTTASQAFKVIDNKYRVGFFTINNNSTYYLPVSKFNRDQKDAWYAKLFSLNASGSTPLRSTLSKVGQLFAGQYKVNSTDEDPMEYSCQQNFALVTTDGYWNTDSNSAVLGLKNKGSNTAPQIGDMDSDSGTRPFYEGPTASSASLADTAKYFYETDLRDPSKAGYSSTTADNCKVSGRDDDDPAITYTNRDVCEDNVFVTSTDNNKKQHMTTYTLGLGVDGTLQYTSDYATAASGDYYCLKTGTCTPTVNWPFPEAEKASAIDDLWHAAVNGRGTYFSAKDPAQVSSGLKNALAQISSKVGAGAAAATSTLNPVAGDNYAYVARYVTAKWTGNLEKRGIDTVTGDISDTAQWCAENIAVSGCTSPSHISVETVNSAQVTFCVTPYVSPTPCARGVLVGAECKEEIPAACVGTLQSKVGTSSDTRTIYVNGGAGLVPFDTTFANLHASYFDDTKLANLSQWPALTTDQQAAAVGGNLVNFLRGQKGYEDSSSNPADNRIFRYREGVLGDVIESQPAFIGKPTFAYLDAGYADFVSHWATRPGTVYVGANDGMLHAFDASNGNERWAYIPTPVLPNLWKLADKSYASNHVNFVNGPPVISDVCAANCSDPATAVWKTILVGSLHSGGRGYYALDVTDPDTPSLLWEFTNANDADLGYSYGDAVVTKKANGTWVVLLTSGYNNVSGGGDGKGYLYVLNPITGDVISKLGTGEGSTTTPSGLAMVNAWADNAEKNNTTTYVYGGDLLGNVWRFNLDTSDVLKFAVLKDDLGGVQPITVKPELGQINSKRVVFVGTGKYLETADLSDTQRQTVYAIKDDNATATLDNPRTATGPDHFVTQTMTTSGTTRTSTSNLVDWSSQRGWYVDLDAAKPSEGSERVNVNMQLVRGSLLVGSVVPANSVCSPGGYSWFNYFYYKTGGSVDATGGASNQTSAPIVGINILYVGGTPVGGITTATGQMERKNPPFRPGSPSGFQKKRAIWREIVQ